MPQLREGLKPQVARADFVSGTVVLEQVSRLLGAGKVTAMSTTWLMTRVKRIRYAELASISNHTEISIGMVLLIEYLFI